MNWSQSNRFHLETGYSNRFTNKKKYLMKIISSYIKIIIIIVERFLIRFSFHRFLLSQRITHHNKIKFNYFIVNQNN